MGKLLTLLLLTFSSLALVQGAAQVIRKPEDLTKTTPRTDKTEVNGTQKNIDVQGTKGREGRQDWDEESRQNVLQTYQGLLNQPNLNFQAQQALLSGQQGQFNNQLGQGQQGLFGNQMNLQGQQGMFGNQLNPGLQGQQGLLGNQMNLQGQQGLFGNQMNPGLQGQQGLFGNQMNLQGQQGLFGNQLNPGLQGQQGLLGNQMNLQGQQGLFGNQLNPGLQGQQGLFGNPMNFQAQQGLFNNQMNLQGQQGLLNNQFNPQGMFNNQMNPVLQGQLGLLGNQMNPNLQGQLGLLGNQMSLLSQQGIYGNQFNNRIPAFFNNRPILNIQHGFGNKQPNQGFVVPLQAQQMSPLSQINFQTPGLSNNLHNVVLVNPNAFNQFNNPGLMNSQINPALLNNQLNPALMNNQLNAGLLNNQQLGLQNPALLNNPQLLANLQNSQLNSGFGNQQLALQQQLNNNGLNNFQNQALFNNQLRSPLNNFQNQGLGNFQQLNNPLLAGMNYGKELSSVSNPAGISSRLPYSANEFSKTYSDSTDANILSRELTFDGPEVTKNPAAGAKSSRTPKEKNQPEQPETNAV